MRAFLIAALVALAGCQFDEPTLGGTILSVVEADRGGEADPSPNSYENLLVPEVAWQVEVRLDDGAELTVIQNGDKRYAPGDRVRVLKAEDGELLL
jgi:hypothetical protein